MTAYEVTQEPIPERERTPLLIFRVGVSACLSEAFMPALAERIHGLYVPRSAAEIMVQEKYREDNKTINLHSREGRVEVQRTILGVARTALLTGHDAVLNRHLNTTQSRKSAIQIGIESHADLVAIDLTNTPLDVSEERQSLLIQGGNISSSVESVTTESQKVVTVGFREKIKHVVRLDCNNPNEDELLNTVIANLTESGVTF